MASNRFTQQPPIAGNSTKVILAERAYIAASATAYADPGAKLNGADPAGWTDLGIVAGSKVELTYNKEVRYVETGIDKVARGAYTMGKSAEAKFTLEQFDMGVIQQITGLTPVAVGGIGNKIYMGQDDIVEKALLFVGTNKVDAKEHHTYCKNTCLSYSIAGADDARVLEVSARLYGFDPGNGTDTFWVLFILN